MNDLKLIIIALVIIITVGASGYTMSDYLKESATEYIDSAFNGGK